MRTLPVSCDNCQADLVVPDGERDAVCPNGCPGVRLDLTPPEPVDLSGTILCGPKGCIHLGEIDTARTLF